MYKSHLILNMNSCKLKKNTKKQPIKNSPYGNRSKQVKDYLPNSPVSWLLTVYVLEKKKPNQIICLPNTSFYQFHKYP